MNFLRRIDVSLGHTHPCTLACLSNGTVAFLKSPFFRETFDMHPQVDAFFGHESFVVMGADAEEEFSYGEAIEYKSQPLLLAWLKQQNLTSPF